MLIKQLDAADRPLGLGHNRLQNMPEVVGHSRHHRLVEQLTVIFKGASEVVTFHDLERKIQFGHARVECRSPEFQGRPASALDAESSETQT